MDFRKEKGTEYLEVLLKYLTGSARNLPIDELNETVIQLFEEGGDLKEGLPIKTIERITGFPAEEIHRFKEKSVHPA
ncbi:MAG TPA: hypothetical protein VK186_20660 [Candidatus Deferrimicrobium sp.]|nr:hypothetical protein [Candidatus Deferrimicrobium sp.]